MTGFTTQIIDRFHVQKQMQEMTNASVEPFKAKLKSFRATFREVDDIKFYSLKVTKLHT